MAVFSDDFTGTNGNPPDPSNWRVQWGLPDIQSNQLYFDIVATDRPLEVVYSKFKVSGDFTADIDYDVTGIGATNSAAFKLNFEIEEGEHEFQIQVGYLNSGKKFQRGYVNGGSWSYFSETRTNDTGKLRIARTGNTSSVWYRDGAGDWDQITSSFSIGTGDGYIKLSMNHWDSTPSANCSVDNFLLQADSIEYDAEPAYVHTFTGSNGSAPNPLVWDNTDGEIQSNQLRFNTSAGNEMVNSVFTVAGDFEVEMPFTLNTHPETLRWYFQMRATGQTSNDVFAVLREYRTGGSHQGNQYVCYKVNGGTEDPVNSIYIGRDDLTGKLRLRRVGDVLYGDYYHPTYGWTNITSETMSALTDEVEIGLWMRRSDSNPTAEIDIDDFTVVRGTVTGFGWTSTTTTTTTTAPQVAGNPSEIWAVDPLWSEADSQVYQNRSYRQIIKAPLLTESADWVRIQFKAQSNDCVVTDASIGLRDTVANYDGPPTRVTFNNGDHGITIPSGTSVWSDWVYFPIDVANEYLVHYGATGQGGFYYIHHWTGGAGENPGDTYYSIDPFNTSMWEVVDFNNDTSVESHIESIEGDASLTTTSTTTTTTTTVDPAWVDAWDDFECLSNCTDTGECYDETGPGISIKPKGNWNKDYKPKKIRVRGNGASSWGGMRVRDNVGGGNIIAQTDHTNSPQIADLDFSGTGDIERIDLPYDCTDGIWFSADEFSTTTTSSTTTTTTTTAPFEEWDDIYYYRFTQAIANRMPDWTRAQADKYSVMQQLLNVTGRELEDLVESMRRATNSMFLRTMDMRHIDLTYQIELPYSFEFEFDFTDPTNPRPKPPDVWGVIDGNIYEIDAVTDNDITSFWYEPVGDRVSLGPDEETHEAGDISKLSTGDVLPATQISIGKLVATYNDPLVPGQLYLTIAGLEKFGYRDDRIDIPGYIELKGTTVKDSEETERVPFSFDATLLTRKFWKEISEVYIYNIEPENATLTISSVAGTMQQIPDQGYIDYDTIGGRSSFWELEEHNLQILLQQLLPVSKVVETEPTMGFQLDVFREWLLVNANGFAIDYATVVDYAIERYRPYIYVLTSDGMLNIYNKLPEYPDLNSMRLLKNRTTGPKTVIYASYEEGVLGDQIKLSAKVLTKSKPVAFYYIQGAKPHHDGELQYISTTGAWGATIGESRVSMVTPTVNPPYKPYTIDLEEGGCYTFVLTTRYSDGTEDKDVKIIWSRYKMPIASFDLTAVDATLTTPRALCFDYNHRLWLGGSFGADFKFKVLNLHADLMLIDYDKKLLYLREEYGRVWIGSDDPTATTTTTTTT